jgi:hypothetical protein
MKANVLEETCSTHGENRTVDLYNILVGNVETKRLLGRPRRRWKIILKWVSKKCSDVDWF